MPHTHEHTLLARLGFADPDRHDPLHDAICRYLTSPVGRRAVATVCGPQDSNYMSNGSKRTRTHEITEIETEREYPVAKGKGANRYLIGFLDAIVSATYRREESTESASGEVETEVSRPIHKSYVIEVKVRRESIGQILRQVNLYRDFINTNYNTDYIWLIDYQFVLATRYKPTDEELETLSSQNIVHLYVGKGFDRYMEEQATKNTMPKVLKEL